MAMTASTVRRAVISVTDKSGVVDLARALSGYGVEIISTGGTAAAIRDAGIPVTDVSEHTGSPEILGGRVKTLHPRIHGGLLAVRGDEAHEADLERMAIAPIDLVVLNLYPFEATVAKGGDFASCIENIDIGGPTMMRAAAKNHESVVVVSDPGQYSELLEELAANEGSTTPELRRRYAAEAFRRTSIYDAAISTWWDAQLNPDASGAVTRTYTPSIPLKYGCNPHQKPAFIGSVRDAPVRPLIYGEDAPTPGASDGAVEATEDSDASLRRSAEAGELPVRVLNGSPGYINFMDAVNAWQLVHEARAALGLPAAASFKHVSPAGVGLAVPLTESQAAAYDVVGKDLTPAALAYVRARNADPMCSFGDFAAVSEVVDAATARILKPEVSDGIVAPGYDDDALEILRSKKGGGFIVMQADPAFVAPAMEYREVFGMCFAQRRNDRVMVPSDFERAVTARKDVPESAVRDLLLAATSVKYTQSNSVGFAVDGQMVGVGAGQQSRVDCVKLAMRKLQVWHLRQHPKVLALPFRKGVKRPDKVNARVRYIEGDFTPTERAAWLTLFEHEPEPLLEAERAEWLASLSGVALASDAFFPFRDSIDAASRVGVEYLCQPGGSVNDGEVVGACDEYGMAMVTHGVRLFHH